MKESLIKELATELPDFKDLFEFAYGAIRWRILEAALALNLFDYLESPVSADDAAVVLQTHPENTRRLLDGMAALKLLSKQDGIYCNTPLSSAFLVSNRPTYIGFLLRDQGNMGQMTAEKMTQLVKNGPEETDQQDGDPEYWGIMVRHYANYLRAGITQLYLSIVENQPEVTEPTKLLDLGGGPGITAIALSEKYSGMKAVVFEQPVVAEVANEIIAHYGMQEHVSTIAGDYRKDSIGEGYDLVLAGFTLNYAKNELSELLIKVQAAMEPGGVFISMGDGLTAERTEPADYVMGMLPMALSGQDMCFDKGEVATTLKRTGFELICSYVVQSPVGPMDIDVSRKPLGG